METSRAYSNPGYLSLRKKKKKKKMSEFTAHPKPECLVSLPTEKNPVVRQPNQQETGGITKISKTKQEYCLIHIRML